MASGEQSQKHLEQLQHCPKRKKWLTTKLEPPWGPFRNTSGYHTASSGGRDWSKLVSTAENITIYGVKS